MKYIIETAKLRFGDILLMRTNDPTCLKIREISKSNYSHALVYNGRISCLESNVFGVQSANPKRIVFESSDDLAVFRLKDEAKISYLQTGFYQAAHKIGMGYASRKELMKSYLNTLESAQEDKRQYCTRFVAQLYKESGIDIVPNADYCSPRDIEESTQLKQIKNVLRVGSQVEIESAMSKNNVIDLQTDATFSFLENVRRLTGEDIQTFVDVEDFLLRNDEFDDEINNFIIESKYLELGDIEKSQNECMYDTELFIKTFGYTYCRDIAESEYENELLRMQNFDITMKRYDYLFKLTEKKYFKSNADCFKRQLVLAEERFRVFKSVLGIS